ncbi:hypothetical protein NC653_024955 [Populus alba x Populus x berolinensis]|uniref:Uncharacterized protein n=1 Tax=Populus alba x Populus x berolinensis TaxID=444605 RepID=A0AAD6Q767_9ROSI|nr:hypothetical protein NC653_024955 [Populus alba x Populus x berolinensis]
MKAYSASTSQSSVKSSATNPNTTAMEERDSCYFPGCRKDANCNCDICLASINATLDLMPVTIHKVLSHQAFYFTRQRGMYSTCLLILQWSPHREDLNRRLRFLQSELKGFVANVKVSNCSFMDSIWEINQDGLLLNSRCVLYKSAMEEWSDGRIGYSIRKANTSWVHRNWAASVVQLDPNTWILEYERSLILHSSTLFSAVAEIFKYRMSRAMKSMNPVFWLFSDFEHQYRVFTAKDRVKIIPT